MKKSTKKLTLLAMSVALAMILSYIEFLLPPIWSAVPGIKLGLANIVIIFLLYRMGIKYAAITSFVRVALSALLFGSVLTLAYSAAGAILSLTLMALFKKLSVFSTVGVSIVGGVSHNLGQIIMAMIILGTREIGYYMAVLAVTGVISGVFIGIAGSLMLKYIKRI